MKQLAIAFALLIGFALVGCGSTNTNSSKVNGNWNATLVSGGNSTVFAFGTSLKTNGDGSLTVSNFKFTSNSPCFVSGETETGSFTLSGNFSGSMSGSFGMTVQSGDPSGNTLTLSGTENGNTISGTWNLVGSGGCTGNGAFTMTKA
ncbi:MAG TPA: hypothetical protein VMS18_01905 [Candidatus Binatia bacterium]|nr:hypothetical protein [Candidatus Binatia bacterium]